MVQLFVMFYCLPGASCRAYIKEQLAGRGQSKLVKDMESDEPVGVLTCRPEACASVGARDQQYRVDQIYRRRNRYIYIRWLISLWQVATFVYMAIRTTAHLNKCGYGH